MRSDGREPLLVVLASLVAITVASNTTAAVAQPLIGDTFLAGPADVAWIVFGYSATFAVGTALWGGVAARIGLIRAVVAGVMMLGAGSIAAALAPSLELVVMARLLQGLGSGAIPTLATALIAGRFAGRDRARALGVIIAAVAGGQALGPLIGGVLLEVGGWRPAVSIGMVALPAAFVLARSQRGRAVVGIDPRPMDWLGAGLVGTAALSLTFGLNRGPLLGAEPPVLLAVVLGFCAALATVARAEDENAFIPNDILRHPVFRRVVPLGALGMSAYTGTVVLIPVLAVRIYRFDGIELGLMLLPMAGMAAISATNNGRVQARIGPAATTRLSLTLLGAAPIIVGLAVVALGPPLIALGLAIFGVGFGLLNAPLLAQLTEALSGARQPIGVGVYNLCFFLGGAAGAAVASAIVQSGAVVPGLASVSLPGFTAALLLLAAGPLAAALFLPQLGSSGADGAERRCDPMVE